MTFKSAKRPRFVIQVHTDAELSRLGTGRRFIELRSRRGRRITVSPYGHEHPVQVVPESTLRHAACDPEAFDTVLERIKNSPRNK